MRKDWGLQMRALTKPGGYLVALVYPMEPKNELGPPFFVRPEHYTEHLGEGWRKVLDEEPTTSLPSHVGRERLVVWIREELN
jgi:methyl halide transferase